jgi:hypothetical protein
VPLNNGVASVTNSSLIASTNSFGNHFITASYSGDANFSPANATVLQKVHASATTLTLTSAVSSITNVIFSAAVTSNSSITNLPTGMVSFWEGTKFLDQVPLNSGAFALVTITNPPFMHHSISATYASDTLFASSSANLTAAPPNLLNPTVLPNGNFQFSFTSSPAVSFTVLSSSDLNLPLSAWTVLGPAAETSLGHYNFTDSTAGSGVRFYLVRSP